GFTSAACSFFGSLITKTPHIITCHDVFTSNQFSGLTGSLKKIILGLILATVDRIHCVTNDAKNNLLSYLQILKIFKKKIIVIPHGIEVKQFLNAEKRDLRCEYDLPENTFLIGFLGRFMSQKGFRYLVEAFIELKKKNDLPKKPIILCFGEKDGFFREEMRDVQRKGLSESILLLPFVADVASTLKGLDVVVMPSLWEACGLLAMEAIVAGVPLIGTNCIGLREVIRDTPANIVPIRDSLALSEALILEMKNPSITMMKNFAAAAATRFDVAERAAEIERLMLEVIRLRAKK
nr:glycosyltransferase family 4 protein [Saprospiraceae bacterium]